MKMRQPVFAGPVPKCTDAETYEQWKQAAAHLRPACGFCSDCTPEYKGKMRLQKRCENLGVLWATDEHGFVEGYLPSFHELDLERKKRRAAKVAAWAAAKEAQS